MKKMYAFFLVAVLGMATVAGCGDSGKANTEETKKTEDSQETEGKRSKKLGEADEKEDADAESEDEKEADEKKSKIDFEEQVVVDNENYTIKVTNIDPDNDWGYTLKVYVENKSDDQTYSFSLDSAAVNGVQCSPYFGADVAAGKKSNEEINFNDDIFEDKIITDFTDIELSFVVYNDEWDLVDQQMVHIYPEGEDNAVVFERKEESSDEVILDNEYIKVTVIGYDQDDVWGYGVKTYIENKTDKSVQISTDESSVNGYMIDPYYAARVTANKVAFSTIWFDEEDFESNDIEDVEEIEFRLLAYDYDDWSADDLADEVIVLKP